MWHFFLETRNWFPLILSLNMCENIPNPLVFVAKYQSPDAKMKRYSCWYTFSMTSKSFLNGKYFPCSKNWYLVIPVHLRLMGNRAITEEILLGSCNIAPWQMYHAGWRDRKGNSDIKVEVGDTLYLCNNKCGQLYFGKYSPFCDYGQCLSLFSHAGGLVII